jgi:hypothetical protein
MSAAWYTCPEQGRGGAPSADVPDRIARAMMLTNAEREHLFLLGLGRLPAARYHAPEGISPACNACSTCWNTVRLSFARRRGT